MKKDKLENKIRKRRFFLKLSVFIIFIAVIIAFALKSDYFIIKNVIVKDNKYVPTKEVLAMINLSDDNIFSFNGEKVKDLLCNNPYIEDITMKKKLPCTVEIYVKEKAISGLVQFKSGYINVDSEGKMVQIVNQFPGNGLPLIEGIKVEQYIPNDSLIKKDDIKIKALKECLKASAMKELKNKIFSINIADSYGIIFKTTDGIEIRVGDWNDLDYKLSYAYSILNSSVVKGSKGYIEIQPDGSGIFKKTQQEVKK